MAEVQAQKLAHLIVISDEQAAEGASLAAAFRDYLNATPEQRAAWAQEAAAQRATERAEATPVPLTLDTVLDKLGWSREYAAHFVQPYCTCGDSYDGWDLCVHAQDLGLRP